MLKVKFVLQKLPDGPEQTGHCEVQIQGWTAHASFFGRHGALHQVHIIHYDAMRVGVRGA